MVAEIGDGPRVDAVCARVAGGSDMTLEDEGRAGMLWSGDEGGGQGEKAMNQAL